MDCTDNIIDVYPTFSEAKVACSRDDECRMIFDAACDGDEFYNCREGKEHSSGSWESCGWIKDTGR